MLKILFIYDRTEDYKSVMSVAQETTTIKQCEGVPDLPLAMKMLECADYDCVLLSLNEETEVDYIDSEEIRFLQRRQPLLVVCNQETEPVARRAMLHGAHGYLQIDRLDASSMAKSIDLAFDRFGAQNRKAVEGERAPQYFEKQLSDLLLTRDAIPSGTFGSPLQRGNPELFAELVSEYAALIEVSMDHRAFRITANASKRLSIISKRLGDVGAGPRDVIELFGTALKAKSKNRPLAKSKAYSDTALLMALELMGYLVSYYRSLVMRTNSNREEICE